MNKEISIEISKPIPFFNEMFSRKEDSFSIKIGGTTFDVRTQFNTDGKQTILEQFEQLLMRHKF